MQTKFWIPKYVQDTWTGPEYFCLTKALRHASITPKQFHGYWKAKVQSCVDTKRGKTHLLELLEKGGLRRGGDKVERLQLQIWFVNEVVGRNEPAEPEPEPDSAPTRKVCACLHICVNTET